MLYWIRNWLRVNLSRENKAAKFVVKISLPENQTGQIFSLEIHLLCNPFSFFSTFEVVSCHRRVFHFLGRMFWARLGAFSGELRIVLLFLGDFGGVM